MALSSERRLLAHMYNTNGIELGGGGGGGGQNCIHCAQSSMGCIHTRQLHVHVVFIVRPV